MFPPSAATATFAHVKAGKVKGAIGGAERDTKKSSVVPPGGHGALPFAHAPSSTEPPYQVVWEYGASCEGRTGRVTSRCAEKVNGSGEKLPGLASDSVAFATPAGHSAERNSASPPLVHDATCVKR